jgi:hypothetical protein
LRSAVGQELEDWVAAQNSVVILVLVASENAVDPGADHLLEAVLREVRVAEVVECGGEGTSEPNVLVELADWEQPGVTGELTGRRLDDERRAEKTKDLLPDAW